MFRKLTFFAILAIVLMSSCSSYKIVSQTKEPVIAGERIQVHLNNGEIHTFVVVVATPDSLKGENITIAKSDIVLVKRKKLSAVRSIFAGLGIFYLTLVVVFTAAVLALAQDE